ncbi:MAG: CBS domain-containing protein [Arenimonas sp.]|jgi:CBS domain-containing protein|nr:CBS domain-containing protein [Arenimonas sp.]
MKNVNAVLHGKSAQVYSLSTEASVLDAIRMMAEHRIGSVLVMENGKLTGIVTERDYARKVILLGRSSGETPIADIMSSPVVSVKPTDTVSHCMALMTDNKFRHLPVCDGDELLGLISIGDLVKAVIEQQQEEISQLQHYIAG